MLVKLIFLCVICCCINSNLFAQSVLKHDFREYVTESIYCDYHEKYHNYSYWYWNTNDF